MQLNRGSFIHTSFLLFIHPYINPPRSLQTQWPAPVCVLCHPFASWTDGVRASSGTCSDCSVCHGCENGRRLLVVQSEAICTLARGRRASNPHRRIRSRSRQTDPDTHRHTRVVRVCRTVGNLIVWVCPFFFFFLC